MNIIDSIELKPFLVEIRSWTTNEAMDVVVWSTDTDTAFKYFDEDVGRNLFRAKSVIPLFLVEKTNEGRFLLAEKGAQGDMYELDPKVLTVAVPSLMNLTYSP
jgi:hypothetical protein